ncbi:MAG: hypothetical protein ACAH89_12055 [Rariglobus sp.]
MSPHLPKAPQSRLTWIYFAGLFAIILAAKLALIDHFGNSTPFWDQWSGQAKRLFIPALEDHLDAAALFRDHNQHHIFCTRVLVLGLLELNGLWDPKVEMVAQAFLHTGFIVLLIGLCARQLAATRARLLFTLFAVVVLSIPFGWENILWGFQSQFYFVLFWGLLGIICCWQNPTLSARWWLGVFFFSLGLISMAGGLLAPAAACMIVFIRAMENRTDLRRQVAGLAVLAVVVGAGLVLTNQPSGSDNLRASNLLQFTTALLEVASWPIKIATFAPLFQAPLVILLIWALRTRRPASDPAWLLVTLGLWGVAQSAAIAYGRAAEFRVSRYTDNLTITLVVGFACLLHLCITLTGRPRRHLIVLTFVWVAVVGGGIIESCVERLPARIQRKYEESLIQENHVRTFIATGDIQELLDKPRLHIPSSKPAELAVLLNNPTLRAILPTNIRSELQPVRITPSAPAGFRPDGFAPGPPKPAGTTTWGSFDSDTHHTPVGVIELHFPAGGRTSWLTFSVTGATQTPGLALALIDEKGLVQPIALPADTGPCWRPVVVHRPNGPFTLRITDESPVASLAFTYPKEIGFATIMSDFLQAQAPWIALLGIALAGLGARAALISPNPKV